MPYRAELRRPDLKGVFKCTLCSKVFCHSSSLSRHRMQAHFKSYTCTLCNKEITSNETLRAHMYRKHQISRMFMCRCCNWAFPDKTSLHIHVQAMASSNTPGNVSIIAKSTASPPIPGELAHYGLIDSDSLGHLQSVADMATPPPSSIFPAMPSRDVLISRLRERALISGVLEQMHPGAHGSYRMQFGEMELKQDESSDEFDDSFISDGGDGNNNSLDDKHSRSSCGDADMDVADTPTADDAVAEDAFVEYAPVQSLSHSRGQQKEEMLRKLSKEQMQLSKVPSSDAYIVMPDDCPVQSSISSAASERSGELPTARSAISASPLNSLLYHKKLNAVLRKGSAACAAQPGGHPHEQAAAAQMIADSLASLNGMAKLGSSLTPPVTVDTHDHTSSGSSDISPHSQVSSSGPSPQSALGGRRPAKPCDECQLLRGQLALADSRNQFMASKSATLDGKLLRMHNRVQSLEANAARYESEGKQLRNHCEALERMLIDFQERALQQLEADRQPDADGWRHFLMYILESCRTLSSSML